MVDNVKNANLFSNVSGTSGTSSKTEAKKQGEIGKDEFLTLLVNQLKNQDPLEPMKNEEFAVNLAQFSQLEQLVGINNKLGGDTSAAGLAGYLGTEVTLNTDKLQVEGGNGGYIKVTLPTDASAFSVDIVNSSGQVVDTKVFSGVTKGENRIMLDDLAVGDGEYSFKINALNSSGAEMNLRGDVAGIVSGFIPGADPKLLVNGKEVSPSDVRRAELLPQFAGSDDSGEGSGSSE